MATDPQTRTAAQRPVKVRDADRVLRCWKCKAERVLTAHEYATRMDTRTPLTSPYEKCECGGFFALHHLQRPEASVVR